MPELPDVELYLSALRPRILDQRLLGIRLRTPFLLRSVEPPLTAYQGLKLRSLARLGNAGALTALDRRRKQAREESNHKVSAACGAAARHIREKNR